MTSSKSYGYCKWYDAKKRYGFIADQGGWGDLFLHISGFADDNPRTPDAGDPMEYQVVKAWKGDGRQAVSARVVEEKTYAEWKERR